MQKKVMISQPMNGLSDEEILLKKNQVTKLFNEQDLMLRIHFSMMKNFRMKI